LKQFLLAGLFWLFCAATTATTTAATPEADNLFRILRLSEIIAIMHDEGLDYADDIDQDMLNGQGGQFWKDGIKHLYDPKRIEAALRDAIAAGMDNLQISKAVDFYQSEHGQRLITLEVSARSAMFDPDIEAMARANYHNLAAGKNAKFLAVTRFVEVNDLLGLNIAGALASNYKFYRGLVDGEAMDKSEREILADVWAQEKEIHDETESWLYGFLLMAYSPLGLDELEDYITFSKGAAGQALNQALFDGFDLVYNAISYELGMSVARAMKARDL
jgi:hypothetical protein